MSGLTRNQVLGLSALLAVIVLIGVFTLGQAFSRFSRTESSLHEAFPHAPAAPPPVTPPAGSPLPVSQFAPNPQPPAAASEEIKVYVVGAVRHPGVYRLNAGARWEDALKAAGGPLPNAAPDAVNLALKAKDEARIVIPTKSQAAKLAPSETYAPASPAIEPGAASSGPHHGGAGHSGKLTDPSQGRIDLNSATEEQLERVPGIGSSTAAKILEHRKQNGGFKTVEDLMQVSGIGEKRFEKMRPFLSVK
jgi:competence protein ComEA